MSLFPELVPKAKRRRPKRYAQQKAEVVAAVSSALSRKGLPPLDRGLRDGILPQQVANLLAGGFKIDEIRRAAVELALGWNLGQGHSAVYTLQRVVQQRDIDESTAAHTARQAQERQEGIDPRVAAALIPGPFGRRVINGERHPSNHGYQEDGKGSCKVCEGPPGVHVKHMNYAELEQQAMADLREEREKRRGEE